MYRKDGKRPWQDATTMRELYVERRLSTQEVADELDCTKETVRLWLDKHGIGTRSISEGKKSRTATLKDLPDFKTDGNHYEVWTCDGHTVRVTSLMAVAMGVDPHDIFGKNSAVTAHHKNEIEWDNRPGNIELVSRSDHAKIHENWRETPAHQ